MSADIARPGEIELEAGPEPPALDPALEPEAEVTEQAEVVDEPVAEPEPVVAAGAVKPAPTMVPVGDLISERTTRKALEKTLKQIEPLLQRMTPELQAAILEGRALTAPPVNTREVETERLTKVAEKFGLVKMDSAGNQVPDLETAARVDGGIRETVREELAPMQQQTLRGVAEGNMQKAVAFAEANGYDVETIRESFETLLRQPQGAAMLADPKVALEVWHGAVGKAVAAGKIPTPRAPAAAPVAPVKPPVIGSEGGRRQAGQASIRLAPPLQKLYRESGMDPAKSFSSKADLSNPGSIELE